MFSCSELFCDASLLQHGLWWAHCAWKRIFVLKFVQLNLERCSYFMWWSCSFSAVVCCSAANPPRLLKAGVRGFPAVSTPWNLFVLRLLCFDLDVLWCLLTKGVFGVSQVDVEAILRSRCGPKSVWSRSDFNPVFLWWAPVAKYSGFKFISWTMVPWRLVSVLSCWVRKVKLSVWQWHVASWFIINNG